MVIAQYIGTNTRVDFANRVYIPLSGFRVVFRLAARSVALKWTHFSCDCFLSILVNGFPQMLQDTLCCFIWDAIPPLYLLLTTRPQSGQVPWLIRGSFFLRSRASFFFLSILSFLSSSVPSLYFVWPVTGSGTNDRKSIKLWICIVQRDSHNL